MCVPYPVGSESAKQRQKIRDKRRWQSGPSAERKSRAPYGNFYHPREYLLLVDSRRIAP